MNNNQFTFIADSNTSELEGLRRLTANLFGELASQGEAVVDTGETNSQALNESETAEETVEEAAPNTVEANYRNYNDNNYPAAQVDAELSHIEENTGSGNISQVTSRFSSAIWYEAIHTKQVTLAGLGGIGSYVAFLLGRMNIDRLYLYDDDIVEEGNMSGQLYSNLQIGLAKTEATVDNLHKFCTFYHCSSLMQKFTSISRATNIMICGFDNMEARKIFFESWRERVVSLPDEERKKCLFIDGRLAAEEFQIFCITGDDLWHMKKYATEWLFSDSDAETTVCSYKQTSFMANMIGSYIVNIFTNFVTRECDSPIPRCVPFFTSYDASTMLQKIEMV